MCQETGDFSTRGSVFWHNMEESLALQISNTSLLSNYICIILRYFWYSQCVFMFSYFLLLNSSSCVVKHYTVDAQQINSLWGRHRNAEHLSLSFLTNLTWNQLMCEHGMAKVQFMYRKSYVYLFIFLFSSPVYPQSLDTLKREPFFYKCMQYIHF